MFYICCLYCTTHYSADDYNSGYMQALAMVHSNGHVFWPPIVKLRSTCNIDITYFPFDDQICELKLGSWAYDGFQVEMRKYFILLEFSQTVKRVYYNSTLSMLFKWSRVMIVRWQSDLVNTKESVLPVCDKPFSQEQTNSTESWGDQRIVELCLVIEWLRVFRFICSKQTRSICMHHMCYSLYI